MTTGIAVALSALAGLAIGSFLNVCITRLPAGESVVSPGSRCRSCRVPVRWHDNIPVVSYLVLGGRCRACGSPIGIRYLLVELTTALAFAAVTWAHWPHGLLLLSRLVFTALLVALFWTDVETERLPNALTLPGTAVGVAFSIVAPPGLAASLGGVVFGGGVLLLIRWAWRRATGVEGMGLGDVKMLAMIGAFLGWQQVVFVLFLSSLAGALVGLALVVAKGKSMQSHLPFGTFLAAAAWAAAVMGGPIVEAYIRSLP